MMPLGFVSAILPEEPLEAIFTTAATLGYDCVELMCWPVGKAERRYAGVTHVDVTALDERQVDHIRSLIQQTGVQISGLGYYPNPLAPDPDESATAIAHLRLVIKAAATLGVNQANTFIGRDWTKSVADNWPRFLEVWPPLVEFASEQGVLIGIENCPMLFGKDEWPGGKNLASSPAIWRQMFADIPHPAFGLNFDPSHLVWLGIDYLQPLHEFADRIFHVHAKDVRMNQPRLRDLGILAHPNDYHDPKLPGLGEVEWGKFFSVLGDVGYRGPVCVEVEDRAYEANTEMRQLALQQSCTYLRQFLPRRVKSTNL